MTAASLIEKLRAWKHKAPWYNNAGYADVTERCLGDICDGLATLLSARSEFEYAPLTEEGKREAVEVMADAIATCAAGYPDEQEQAGAALTALLERFDLRRKP